MAKDWVKEGYIARLHDRDDSDIWKGWKRHLFALVPYLTILNTLVYLGYLGFRIFCVISAQKKNRSTFVQAWIFIGVEIAVAIPSLMHNIWTMWAIKERTRPKLRLVSEDVPTVDVFVTCCGEDDDVVLDTVRGACDIDYPRDRFRVIVLDDGKSASLEAAVHGLDMIYRNVVYIARPKSPGVPHHFKAGNLNYGLDASHNLPGGAGTYMAALDADMVRYYYIHFSIIFRNPELTNPLLRFPNVTGSAPFCRTCLSMIAWDWPVLLSYFTTHLPQILLLNLWISLFMLSSPSRML